MCVLFAVVRLARAAALGFVGGFNASLLGFLSLCLVWRKGGGEPTAQPDGGAFNPVVTCRRAKQGERHDGDKPEGHGHGKAAWRFFEQVYG